VVVVFSVVLLISIPVLHEDALLFLFSSFSEENVSFSYLYGFLRHCSHSTICFSFVFRPLREFSSFVKNHTTPTLIMSCFYPPQYEQITLSHQRQQNDKLSDLYALILTTEHLERMWIKQTIDDEQYNEKCKTLIIKYKSLLPVIQPYYPNVADFFNEYCPELSSAKYRLMDQGQIPLSNDDNTVIDQVVIAETTQYFITMIDALELQLCETSELYPELKRLCDSLDRIQTMQQTHSCKSTMNAWLQRLQQMKATDKLNADQVKQIKFDLVNAYDDFHSFLKQ